MYKFVSSNILIIKFLKIAQNFVFIIDSIRIRQLTLLTFLFFNSVLPNKYPKIYGSLKNIISSDNICKYMCRFLFLLLAFNSKVIVHNIYTKQINFITFF